MRLARPQPELTPTHPRPLSRPASRRAFFRNQEENPGVPAIMKEMERFSTWQLVGIGLAAWVIYAWFINPVWAEYQFTSTHIAWFVVHAALAVGFLLWRGWSNRKPEPMEEDSDAAA